MKTAEKTPSTAPKLRVISMARKLAGKMSTGLLFLVIPVVFFITVNFLTKAKGPQWLPFTFENPYNYLFNSLLLLKGQTPYSIEHPGTTTQVFGAIVLRSSTFASNEDLIKTVLQHPEDYIRLLHGALLVFSVLVLWLGPWLTSRIINNRITGLLIQAPSLFFNTLLWYGVIYGPDLMLVPFSVAAACCCVLLIIPSPQADLVFVLGIGGETASSSRLVRIPFMSAVAGLVCALGIATKLTFFPLVLISLLCCRTKKNLVAFTSSFIFWLAVALLPIYSRLSRFATWTVNLGIHSGRYDSGTVGLPQSNVYLSTLSTLVQSEPLVVIIPLTVTIVLLTLFVSRKQPQTNHLTWRAVLLLFIIQAVCFVVIAKEQGTHYLIPLALTTGLNLVFLYQASRDGDRARLKKTVAWITLASLLALGSKAFVDNRDELYNGLKAQKLDLTRLYQHAEQITQNDVRVDYYFSDSPVYPLCFGNNWAGGAFGLLLQNLYPNKLFFSVFNGQFQTFTELIPPEVILKKYDHLYFLGSHKWFPDLNGFEPDTFQTIDQSGDYSLQKWTRK
jgi:hypothetical protein